MDKPIPEAVLDRLAHEAYQVHCDTPTRAFPNDTHWPKWRAVVQHVANALAQQPAAVDGNWRQKAAEWLEAKAVEQEANNQRWPDHAAAYKEWRDRPGVLRYLAAQVLAAQHQEPKS